MGPGIFMEASRERELPRHMKVLNQLFEQQPFVLGDEFSVADVGVGSMLIYIPMMLKVDLSEYAAVTDYMKRIAERPAFQKTIGARQ
jgi:glutathione S-transferase